MRMAASWFGSATIHRIQPCGAMVRARWRTPLRTVILQGSACSTGKPAAVLASVKGKSLRDGLRPPLTVTARNGQSQHKVGTRRWPPCWL